MQKSAIPKAAWLPSMKVLSIPKPTLRRKAKDGCSGMPPDLLKATVAFNFSLLINLRVVRLSGIHLLTFWEKLLSKNLECNYATVPPPTLVSSMTLIPAKM